MGTHQIEALDVADAHLAPEGGSSSQEVWSPSTAVTLSKSQYAKVGDLLGEHDPNPILGVSNVELTTSQYVLDGTFDRDDEASRSKVRALSELAMQELAERQGKTVEQLMEEHGETRRLPVVE